LIRDDPKIGHGTWSRWHKQIGTGCTCACETSTTCPSGTTFWNRLCLSHWHKEGDCTKPVPLGLGEVKRDLSLCHGTSHIPTMEAITCAMAQTLYHDGAFTCSTCANLCQKVSTRLWNFARKRAQTLNLTLFRATKNCVVIFKAIFLYKMVHLFRRIVVQ